MSITPTIAPVPRSPLRSETPAWRVLSPEGRLLGYVDAFAASEGLRYRASRVLGSAAPRLPLGEFWALDDAVDCFRAA